MYTKESLAALLNGRTYGNEITKEEAAAAKEAGLVVVFGYSDDNVELRGAIDDEIGAFDGTTFKLDGAGVLPTFKGLVEREAEELEFADYFERRDGTWEVKAAWNGAHGQFAWTFTTDVPHLTFDITDDGEPFCRGMVIDLADIVVLEMQGIERGLENLRARFAAWFEREFGPEEQLSTYKDGLYVDQADQNMWLAWRASFGFAWGRPAHPMASAT